MLAELAAANAAYDVIKQTIANGQEIYQAADAMAKYFGLKQQIQAKAHEHGYKSDLEAFMAAEQLKKQEDELKDLMIWQGRPGMWDDWLAFQAQMSQSRKETAQAEVRARMKRKKALVDTITIGIASACALGAVITFVWLILNFAK